MRVHPDADGHLERFHRAQNAPWGGSQTAFDTALKEICQGRKSSHWIWYVFPQIAGLGRSDTAREYALADLAEAVAYLRDPLLRERYREISEAVRDQLQRGVSLEVLLGGKIDALKLVSSLTLFRKASTQIPDGALLAGIIDLILAETANQGYPACSLTQRLF